MHRVALVVLALGSVAAAPGCLFPPICGANTVIDESYYVGAQYVAEAQQDGEISLQECQRLCAAHVYLGSQGSTPTTSGASSSSGGASTGATSAGGVTSTGGEASGGETGGSGTVGTGGSGTGDTGGAEPLSLMDIPPLTSVVACPSVTDTVVTCTHELACDTW